LKRVLLIAICASMVILVTAVPTWSQSRKLCDHASAPDELVNKALERFDAFITRVEGIPPSEYAFLKSEYEQAITQTNNAKLRSLLQHRLYRAFLLREEHAFVRLWLSNYQQKNSDKERVKMLSGAVARYSAFRSELEGYIRYEEAHSILAFPKEEMEDLYFKISNFPLSINLIHDCLVDRIAP
jgi:hypothetical protein